MTSGHNGLRAQLEALERSVPSAAPPEIPAGNPPRTRWLAMAAVLLLGVVIGLGGGRWLANVGEPDASESPGPSATPGASGSETPSRTETPSATPNPSMALTMVPTTGLEAEDELHAITFARGGLVAVGRHGTEGAVWLSQDGASWTLAPELPDWPSTDDPSVLITMTRVVDGPAGMVAVGNFSAIDVSVGVIWHSPDGERWTQVYQGGLSGIEAVSTGGPGYIAVGYVSDDGYAGRHQIWTSGDGQTWTQRDSTAFSGTLNGVAEGSGVTVIVGGDVTHGTSYVSADGINWQAAPAQADLKGVELFSVTYSGGTFLATGRSHPPQFGTWEPIYTIWRSVDGLSWTRVLVGEPNRVVHQVISVGGEVVAIGGLFPSLKWSWDAATPIPPNDTILIWRSTDGTSWDGPTTSFVGPGGITLGQAGAGQELFLPISLLVAAPTYPVPEPAVLRGLGP